MAEDLPLPEKFYQFAGIVTMGDGTIRAIEGWSRTCNRASARWADVARSLAITKSSVGGYATGSGGRAEATITGALKLHELINQGCQLSCNSPARA